jgi:adenine phosphoribosyltransferase
VTPDDLSGRIREVPDFPKKGIIFRDITTLLRDGPAFRAAIDILAERVRGLEFSSIVGMESRGFIFAAPLA